MGHFNIIFNDHFAFHEVESDKEVATRSRSPRTTSRASPQAPVIDFPSFVNFSGRPKAAHRPFPDVALLVPVATPNQRRRKLLVLKKPASAVGGASLPEKPVDTPAAAVGSKTSTPEKRLDTPAAAMGSKTSTPKKKLNTSATTMGSRTASPEKRLDTPATTMDSKITTPKKKLDTSATTMGSKTASPKKPLDTPATTIDSKTSTPKKQLDTSATTKGSKTASPKKPLNTPPKQKQCVRNKSDINDVPFSSVTISITSEISARLEMTAKVLRPGSTVLQRIHVLTIKQSAWGDGWEMAKQKLRQFAEQPGKTKAQVLAFRAEHLK